MEDNERTAVRSPPLDASRRLRIVAQARRAFLKKGYVHSNLEDIAISAGVSKVTIYRYFKSKTSLLHAVVQDSVPFKIEECRGCLRDDVPLEDALTNFSEKYIEVMNSKVDGDTPYSEISRLVVEASWCDAEIAKVFMDIFYRKLSGPLKDFFEEVTIMQNSQSDDLDLLTKHFINSLFLASSAFFGPKSMPDHNQIRATARRKVRLFLYGCGIDAAPVPTSVTGARVGAVSPARTALHWT